MTLQCVKNIVYSGFTFHYKFNQKCFFLTLRGKNIFGAYNLYVVLCVDMPGIKCSIKVSNCNLISEIIRTFSNHGR
jgi:hypothetical protein